MNKKELYWVGIDVSKADFDAAVVSPGQPATAEALRQLPVRTFSRNSKGVREFVGWLRGLLPKQKTLPVRAVMEATGIYSIQLAVMLNKQCADLSPAIANPQQTCAFRDSLGLRNKTDRVDARALAFFGLCHHPKPYEPLTPAREELRSLSRCRGNLLKQRVAHQAQLREAPASAVSRKIYRREIVRLKKDIQQLEQDMLRVIRADADLKRDYGLLMTIAGVGFVTASTVLAEFGDLRRFVSSRQIAAHAGVTASHADSGNSTPPAHMSKKGNARVRQALYMAALSAIQHNPHMRAVGQRLNKKGKKPMVTLGAIMRKLIVLMRIIIVSGRKYDPLWKTQWRTTPSKESFAQKYA